jgi:DNA-binding transcriptional MerR regulator
MRNRGTMKLSQERHRRIHILREQGFSLAQIAMKIGVEDPSTASYHLNGNCRCEDRAKNGQRGLQK